MEGRGHRGGMRDTVQLWWRHTHFAIGGVFFAGEEQSSSDAILWHSRSLAPQPAQSLLLTGTSGNVWSLPPVPGSLSRDLSFFPFS